MVAQHHLLPTAQQQQSASLFKHYTLQPTIAQSREQRAQRTAQSREQRAQCIAQSRECREQSREQRAQRSSPANSSSRHERGVPVGDYWERKSLEPFLCFPLSLFVFICLFVETKTRFKTTPPTLIKYCHYCNMLAITFFPSLWKSI